MWRELGNSTPQLDPSPRCSVQLHIEEKVRDCPGDFWKREKWEKNSGALFRDSALCYQYPYQYP